MRNLLEYPITHKEAIEIINGFKCECDPSLIGDIRPAVCEWIITRLLEHEINSK